MGPLFVAFGWLILAAVVFVPTFLIAVVMLRSATRAFVLSAIFTAGALVAATAAWVLPTILYGDVMSNAPEFLQSTSLRGPLIALYLSAAAIAGGFIATYLLGKTTKYPPWRRY
jgi:hypothetical protein